VQAFFDAILTIEVGDDIRALFWEDNWLVGCSIKTLDSILRAAISPRIGRSRAVRWSFGGFWHDVVGLRYHPHSYGASHHPILLYLGLGLRHYTNAGTG
jgi:hypothetical protein